MSLLRLLRATQASPKISRKRAVALLLPLSPSIVDVRDPASGTGLHSGVPTSQLEFLPQVASKNFLENFIFHPP